MKTLCGSRGFAGPSACVLRAGHEGPHQYGNFDDAVRQDQSEELERLRAELLRVTELETAIEVRDEDCDRLRAENAALRAENFALAAGQCNNVVGDEGGTPICQEVLKQRAENAALQAKIVRLGWGMDLSD